MKSNEISIDLNHIDQDDNSSLMIKENECKGGLKFNDIMDNMIFVKEHYMIIIFSVLTVFTVQLYSFYCIILFIPAKTYFNTSANGIALICSMGNLSGLMTSLFLGVLSNKFGKINLIRLCLSIICLLHVIICFTKDYYVFLFSNFLIGVFLSINVPLVINILIEYLPLKHRALILNSVWGIGNICNFYVIILTFMIMPEYNETKFKYLLFSFLSIPIIALGMSFVILKDSPRNLIINGDSNEGINLLKNMYLNQYDEANCDIEKKNDFTPKNKVLIIRELIDSNYTSIDSNNDDKADLFLVLTLFNNSNLRKTSIFLTLIMISLSFTQNGLFILLPVIISDFNNPNKFLYNMLIISFFTLIAGPIGGYLCDSQLLGRKYTGVLSGILICLTLIIFIIDINNEFVFSVLLFFFYSINLSAVFTINTEFYPTILRSTAAGYFNFIFNLSCFISQFVYINIYFINNKVIFFLSIFIMMIGCFSFYKLPYETRDFELDSNPNDIKK